MNNRNCHVHPHFTIARSIDAVFGGFGAVYVGIGFARLGYVYRFRPLDLQVIRFWTMRENHRKSAFLDGRTV
jgi:hypothetical protein